MRVIPNIKAVTLKERVRSYEYADMKIAGRSAVETLVALASDVENLSVVNSGRYCNFKTARLCNTSSAAAFGAGIFYYLTSAAALGACLLRLDNAESCSLLSRYLTRTVTLCAGFGRSAFFSSAAAALGAGIYAVNLYRSLAALCRLFKRYCNIRLYIFAAPRCVGVRTSAACAAAAEKA